MIPTAELDATALRESIARGERSVASVVEDALAAASSVDPKLHVFLNLEREKARARARELDERKRSGEPLGALFGVPIVLKANLCWDGVESNCASRILAGYRAPYNATVVQRLLDADAVLLGMSNMDEFAMGSSSENSAFGPTRNPWDEACTPGGSSSGSAVAVASGIVPLALGSDTGGSVRQPAAFCNVFGFKPTYGRVSRYGLIAFGSSLDQISPFARSVRDIELVLSVISGVDERDATTFDEPAVEMQHDAGMRGLRIGVPREYFPDSLAGGVRTACERAIEVLRGLGAEIVPVTLPHTDYATATYYVVATAEASSNLARYDGVRFGVRAQGTGGLQSMFAATREAGFGSEVKRRILLGTYVLSAGYYDAWYGRALKVRTLLRRDFEQAFERVDAIVGPTSPTPAFKLGEKSNDPVAMYLADILTVPVSLAGLPAISAPCGFIDSARKRLPIGLQIVGPARADARVLAVARAYESASSFARERAPGYYAAPGVGYGARS